MERLLLLRLQSVGCAAEAWLNGIPVARTATSGGQVSVPVHEYVLEGDNRLALHAGTPVPGHAPVPRLSAEPLAASVRLVLPRVGQPGSEAQARTLAALDWALPAHEPLLAPAVQQRLVALPIRFPRWRWLDLPEVPEGPTTQLAVSAFVQTLAIALARGDAEAFVQAARLRFDELAAAYQQPVADLAARWRSRIQLLQATKALQLVLPAQTDVRLLPCAEGRLVEPVLADGLSALRTQAAADGSWQAWPLRVAVIDGHCHVVR